MSKGRRLRRLRLGGGEAQVIGCPIDDHSAGCGATDDLSVGLSWMGGSAACATVCPACQGRSFLQLREVGLAGYSRRVAAHQSH